MRETTSRPREAGKQAPPRAARKGGLATMLQIVTSRKIRAIVADCKTDSAVLQALRRHAIRFSIDAYTNYFNVKIPAKTGTIRIYNAGSRKKPLYIVQTLTPVKLTYSSIPTYRPSLPHDTTVSADIY